MGTRRGRGFGAHATSGATISMMGAVPTRPTAAPHVQHPGRVVVCEPAHARAGPRLRGQHPVPAQERRGDLRRDHRRGAQLARGPHRAPLVDRASLRRGRERAIRRQELEAARRVSSTSSSGSWRSGSGSSCRRSGGGSSRIGWIPAAHAALSRASSRCAPSKLAALLGGSAIVTTSSMVACSRRRCTRLRRRSSVRRYRIHVPRRRRRSRVRYRRPGGPWRRGSRTRPGSRWRASTRRSRCRPCSCFGRRRSGCRPSRLAALPLRTAARRPVVRDPSLQSEAGLSDRRGRARPGVGS